MARRKIIVSNLAGDVVFEQFADVWNMCYQDILYIELSWQLGIRRSRLKLMSQTGKDVADKTVKLLHYTGKEKLEDLDGHVRLQLVILQCKNTIVKAHSHAKSMALVFQ